MSSDVVKVKLLDGHCWTTLTTLEQLSIPWAAFHEREYYIGRPKAEFEYVLDLLREGREEMTETAYLEAMFLYGLFRGEPERVVLLNVGGSLFHLREAVAQRIPYIDSIIRWCEETPDPWLFDHSKTFMDRNPTKFQQILAYVETYGQGASALTQCQREAVFYGVEHNKNLCFLCRKAPVCQIGDMTCPCGHLVCKHCMGLDRCKVCCQPLVQLGSHFLEDTEDYPKMRKADAVMQTGFEDTCLTGHPDITVHRIVHRRLTKSAFTYKSVVFHQSHQNSWVVDLPKQCDLLGDSWLQIDYDVPLEHIQSDLWNQCHMITSIELSFDNSVVETITGAVLFALITIQDIHKLLWEPLSEQRSRLIIPLCFFWLKDMGQKLPVGTLTTKCNVVLRTDPHYVPSACTLTSTCWSLTDFEARRMTSASEHIVIMHDSIYSHANQASNLIHVLELPFQNPTKDIIVVVRPQPEHRCMPEPGPVQLIEVLLDGNVALSLDGIFSRKVLGQHLYNIENNSFIYFLPFDILVKRADFAGANKIASSCNLSLFKSVQLRIKFVAGEYDVHVIARHVNMLRFLNGEVGVCWPQRKAAERTEVVTL